MNIAKVLAAQRRAKKFKVLLPYHEWGNGGINVPPEDEIIIEQFLVLLLKLLKEHRVEAAVSRYGHLTLFCPPFNEPVSINIHRPWPQYLFDNFNTLGVVNISDDDAKDIPMVLRFQVMRVRTKSHKFALNEIEKNANHLAKVLVQEIIKQTHKYLLPAKRLGRIQGYTLSINDVLAVSRYGQAKYKSNTAFAGINRFVDKHFAIGSIKFSDREVTIRTHFYYRHTEYSVELRKRDMALLKKFLPDLPLGNNITHEIFEQKSDAITVF